MKELNRQEKVIAGCVLGTLRLIGQVSYTLFLGVVFVLKTTYKTICFMLDWLFKSLFLNFFFSIGMIYAVGFGGYKLGAYDPQNIGMGFLFFGLMLILPAISMIVTALRSSKFQVTAGDVVGLSVLVGAKMLKK